jgi:hypothetical protein
MGRPGGRPVLDSARAGPGVRGRGSCREGVELARALGVDAEGFWVEVVHAQLNLTDIDAGAVRAAAAMAVGEAFGVQDRLQLGFDNGWFVRVSEA